VPIAHYEREFGRELFGYPSDVMKQYLQHFRGDAKNFVRALAVAARVWEQYSAAAKRYENEREELAWSSAYLLYAINANFISTRLFLEGFIAPSGNLARQAVESIATGVLLAFPVTGAYRDWKKHHPFEHKALDRLARNAKHCGAKPDSVRALAAQAKFFDNYSHPSRLAVAAMWKPTVANLPDEGWNIGALFVESYLKQYRQEMGNRISLCGLISNSIAGTQATLKL
jgi:hypothetical protein